MGLGSIRRSRRLLGMALCFVHEFIEPERVSDGQFLVYTWAVHRDVLALSLVAFDYFWARPINWSAVTVTFEKRAKGREGLVVTSESLVFFFMFW